MERTKIDEISKYFKDIINKFFSMKEQIYKEKIDILRTLLEKENDILRNHNREGKKNISFI